jgi:TolB protein
MLVFIALTVAADLALPEEKHLKNVVQLTFGGENAEAYFDQTGKQLIFQSKRGDAQCDAIYRMTTDGKDVRQVSVGGGRTTCGYIRPDNKIIYASTHGHGPGCLDEPDRSEGYVWKVYPEFDLWIADADGKNAKILFQSPGYDAEATVCHKDGRILFTSSRSGDLELYVMDKHGKNVKQLTTTPGYDGGAFFSEDCTKIVWRASRPEGKELEDYQRLLAQNLVRPTMLEIYVADINKKNELSNIKQVTNNGKANFAPYLHPDNKRVLYVSNKGDPRGRDFDIYLVNIDGTGEERITFNPTFDGFPMFSPDGKKLVFASNRNNEKEGETNVFIADWVD